MLLKNICANCGKEYEYEPKRGTYKTKYCSHECKMEFAKKDKLPQYRKCLNCGKEYWWDGTQRNYEGNFYVDTKTYCSFECGKEYKYKKAKESTISRYGAIGFASAEINSKVRQTKLERYGNAGFNNYEKIKQTTLEKYGVENIGQSQENKLKVQNTWKNKSQEEVDSIVNQTKQTKLERYGDETYVNADKAKQTKLERYGDETYNNIEKIKQTNLERYGVTACAQNEAIRKKIQEVHLSKTEEEIALSIEKRKETVLDKYDTEFVGQNEEIKNKIALTNLARYGHKVAIASEPIQKAIREHNLKKWGVEYSIGSAEVQAKIRKTNLEKYGYEYPFQDQSKRKEMEEKRIQTNLKKYGTSALMHVAEFKEKAIQTCLEKYGVAYNCLTDNCINSANNVISKINLHFKEILDRNNIPNTLEFRIFNRSYDFKVRDNILVEIDPVFTHTSTYNSQNNIKNFVPKEPDYHYKKTQLAIEHGYRCVHIWDWDDVSKVVDLFRDRTPLYARNLVIGEVSQDECKEFLDKYHLQNSCNGQNIRLGLYLGTELIEIMTFGAPRYNRNYQYELLRLCSKTEYNVIGGAERLYKHFLKTYKPNSIISYCDNSKFDGDVYGRLGMKLVDKGKPSKHWYNVLTDRHITDNLLRMRGYSQLHNDIEHKKGEDNELLMYMHGYLEVFDCGQSTYIWIKRK